MLPWRKVGKILRGKATPLQLFMACVLGAMIGFVPGVRQAGGLLVVLALLLLVLNANLVVALLVAALSKIMALVTIPVSFAVGGFLLDGPTQPLFKWAINAPVLALMGLDYYVTSGSMVVGAAFGVLCGLIVCRSVSAFRRRMSRIEQDSERYKKYARRPGVKFLSWVLIGGSKGKRTYAQLLERRVGLPIRPVGVIVALLVVGALYALQSVLAGPLLREGIRSALERVNGATVDLDRVDVDLGGGRVTLVGLAMADRGELTEDLFRAAELTGDVDTSDLLRGRIALDVVRVTDASSGLKRARAGVKTRPDDKDKSEGDGKSLEEILSDAERWYERLRQIEGWIDRIPRAPESDGDTVYDRLRKAAGQYLAVRATHLVEGAPKFRVGAIEVNGMRVRKLGDDPVDIVVRNISTQPWLVDGAPQLDLHSRSQRLIANLSLDALSRAGGANLVDFGFKDLASSWMAPQFKGQSPIQGGTIDVRLNGEFDVSKLALPLALTLHDTTITIPGGQTVRIDQALDVALHLSGRLSSPRVRLDYDELGDSLVAVGKAEAARLVQKHADQLIGDVQERINDQIGDRLGGALDGILGGGKNKKKGG
ncbi:MAG: DUF2062 domain-containing protein [Phycisphaeraceae bacterium]|nr:DUF2062 domain-containing protein [Phycisphaeraceae bacterium]